MQKKIIAALLVVLVGVLSFWGYNAFLAPSATEGIKNVQVIVTIHDQVESFNFETDGEFLVDLLKNEEKLQVELEESSFGPMLMGLLGYTADADAQEFFHISINGEAAMYGVGDIPLVDGDEYHFEIQTW